MIRAAAAALGAAFGLGAFAPAAAESLRYCDQPVVASAEQHDRLLRFAAVIKDELERSGAAVALVSRTGLDLGRFGVRYSHAGVSLKAGPGAPWSVRQLYFACDEQRPRLYDQGMAGFVLGTADAATGYVSVVLLPPPAAEALERTARDNASALSLLAERYSANAYPFDTRYQNCNQWLAELIGLAWGGGGPAAAPRRAAQSWLRASGYVPTAFDAGSRLMMWLAAAVVPWLHDDDHPEADKAEAVYRVSMPGSIEALVRSAEPAAERIEFCHGPQQIVVRRGWQPIADGCAPEAGDRVIGF